ncbi:MAG: ATP-binding protein [Lachnospiraceae bacterium]|nr:ATP-binding protein [Candidatus Merdinaster equi]
MKDREIEVIAKKENLISVMDMLDSYLNELDFPLPAHMKLGVAVDELYSNVCNYAYEGVDETTPHTITVAIERVENGVKITFTDHGIPYNPLEKEDPDIHVPLAERQVGGLGIFIVKKTMDLVEYKRENNCNIICIYKYTS